MALAVRWNIVGDTTGRSFLPRPDALEYAAGAQSLAQEGTYLLRIGEVRVRPRYPPGLSMLLAPALRLGVQGEALWRVGAVAGAALAALLAGFAFSTVSTLVAPDRLGGPTFAALLAGGLWAFSPAGFLGGTRVMSDDAAAFWIFCGAGSLVAARLASTRRMASVRAGLAGFSLALAAAIRPPVALLAAIPLAVLATVGTNPRWRARWPGLALAALLGAALPSATVAAVLARSGEAPWRWSAYSLWEPSRYGAERDAFAVRHYLAVEPGLVRAGLGERTNLELGARLLLGLPGVSAKDRLGAFWPALAVPAMILLVLAARSRRGAVRALAPAIAFGGTLWVVLHLLFWGAYYWPSGRFFVGVLALSELLVTSLVGWLWSRWQGWRRAACVVAALALVAGTLIPALAARRTLLHETRFGPDDVRRKVARWMVLSDEERAARELEFDPIEAQALGLLTPERLRHVAAWGELPSTPHVRVLRALGRLPPTGSATPRPRDPSADGR